MPLLGFDEALQLAAVQLRKAGASHDMAVSTARALVLAEAQGISSHGLVRVQQYCGHLANGRAKGDAEPSLLRRKGTAVLVDARQGLAFPACDFAVSEAIGMARDVGICIAAVTNSHHAGVLVDHLRPGADAKFVGLAFANSPAAMPAAGG
ncbi:MAG: Ldh family oxidoreductase, partial [Ramlibacter sp.]|nr:Ldh family oxidoreductase [Ramlibacter sp.]